MKALPSRKQVLDNLSDVDPDLLYDALARAMAAAVHNPKMPSSCPNCGCNFRNDYIIDRDGFVIDPRGQVSFNGKAVAMTPTQVCIFYSIAKGDGRYLTTELLTNRCCKSQGGFPSKAIHVHIHNIRKALAAAGANDPVSNERGRGSTCGYRWIPLRELT